MQHVARRPGNPAITIEVDLLDLDAPNGYTFKEDEHSSTAYLHISGQRLLAW